LNIFGLEITRKKALSPVDSNRGWWPVLRESYAGAWQQNVEVSLDTAATFFATFACVQRISQDIGKLSPVLRQKQKEIWAPVGILPLLDAPNSYQNRIQFIELWIVCKLLNGNTYCLKVRDTRGKVVKLLILDPSLVSILVSDAGDIFYRLRKDNLSSLQSEEITVPASEIIHDRMNCFYHPLVGLSPIYAGGLAAGQGLNIQSDGYRFFQNGAKPSGFLSAPGAISEATATRLKADWQVNYTGDNAGKVAVAGDGIKYEQMRMTAADSQTIEQLKFSAAVVCSVFNVPGYKVGINDGISFSDPESRDQIYYTDCLQPLIESFELCIEKGLALPDNQQIWLETDGLLRMNQSVLFKTLGEGVKGSILSPDEARQKVNLPPVKGGESPMAQQQNYSLAALAKRDAMDNPFAPQTSGGTEPVSDPEDDSEETITMAFELMVLKELSN